MPAAQASSSHVARATREEGVSSAGIGPFVPEDWYWYVSDSRVHVVSHRSYARGALVWYCKKDDLPFKEYLLALALAPATFAKGVLAIYHCQLKVYYDCLLKAPTHKLALVLPNKKARDYNDILEIARKGARGAQADAFALENDKGRHNNVC